MELELTNTLFHNQISGLVIGWLGFCSCYCFLFFGVFRCLFALFYVTEDSTHDVFFFGGGLRDIKGGLVWIRWMKGDVAMNFYVEGL